MYKEIAVTNGYINRMSREELRSKLAEFKLETRSGPVAALLVCTVVLNTRHKVKRRRRKPLGALRANIMVLFL